MGMSFSAVNAASTMSGINLGSWQQRQQGYRDLMAALQVSDLGAAQRAFRTLNGGSASVSGSSPLGQVGQALNVGDLAGAQRAARQMQSVRSGVRPVASAGPAPTLAPTGIGSTLHVTA